MKKCSFCAEAIQDDAIKCRHCGEFLDGRAKESPTTEQPKVSWFYKPASVVVSILMVGPLALPIVWFHPTYSRTKKIVITLAVAVLTYFLSAVTIKAWNSMMDLYKGVLPPM